MNGRISNVNLLLFIEDLTSKVACTLEKLSVLESPPSNNNEKNAVGGRKRKRSTGINESNNGCSIDFQRVSVHSCLHYRKRLEEHGIKTSFKDSKAYCQNKGVGASVLRIDNAEEAVKVWEWLGN